MHLTLVPSHHPALRATAKPVKNPKAVAQLAKDLIATMIAEGGVGLAAPQVGETIRVFVSGVGGQYQVYINPVIVKTSEEAVWREEGCLSLPRLFGQVKRPARVTVQAQHPDGSRFTVDADDLLARVLLHETDHLDGILFPDRMEDLSTLREISQEEWDHRFDEPGETLSDEEIIKDKEL